ncbi:MAG: EcsC family protein [Bifidobacterium tibiigranuli]|nr:EcsC family protein [Bifidobacterium tibiigranuli]
MTANTSTTAGNHVTRQIEFNDVLVNALKVPGVKIDRDSFLRNQFKTKPQEFVKDILSEGPVAAGVYQDELRTLARKIVDTTTLQSSGMSFLTGLPGGFTMAATIPADIAQFYAMDLRMAQQIAYIYGEPDLFRNGLPDDDRVRNQLTVFCGVMFGVAGAASLARAATAKIAKQMMISLPKKALTKTLHYRLIKSIAKVLGMKMTKQVFARGVSKFIPLLGGALSGGMTYAMMRPMGNRLIDALETAHFAYTEESLKEDLSNLESLSDEDSQ